MKDLDFFPTKRRGVVEEFHRNNSYKDKEVKLDKKKKNFLDENVTNYDVIMKRERNRISKANKQYEKKIARLHKKGLSSSYAGP